MFLFIIEQIRKKVEKLSNGKNLNPKERKQEQERMDREIEKYKNLNSKEERDPNLHAFNVL